MENYSNGHVNYKGHGYGNRRTPWTELKIHTGTG